MPQTTTQATPRINLPKPHSGQQKVISEASRFNTLACGRQFGKTTFCQDRTIHPALKGFPTAWFSPTYKSLDPTWEEMKALLEPVTASKDEQHRQLRLIGGGRIDFWSLEDPDASRGNKYKQIVIDEAALVKGLLATWQKVIRAELARYQGTAWFISTPRGIANDFKVMYDNGQDSLKPDWMSWQMGTATNPYITAEELESIRRDTPDLTFQQEYLALFVSWEGLVFKNILEAVGNPAVQRTNKRVVAVDWAGSKGGAKNDGDFTVFLALDTGGEVVEIERFRGLTYPHQMGKLKAFIGRNSPIRTVAEANSMGQPLIEQLNADGIQVDPFITTNASKQTAVEALALAFERHQIKIPDNAVLIGELQSFEAKPTAGGLVRYAAAGNGHDDTVIPLAMAWQYVNQPQSHGGLFEAWRKKAEASHSHDGATLQTGTTLVHAPTITALAAQGASQKQGIDGWRIPRKQAPVLHQQILCGSCGSVPASYGATWRCICGTTGSMN